MIKSAVVIANPEKEWAGETKAQVKRFLRSRGIAVKNGKADILITVGGDGTILHNKNRYPFPVFGIGNERSFICQANSRNWRAKLGRALARGGYEERSMLACEVDGRKTEMALNEVCVRNAEHRIVDFSLHVDKKRYEFRADGVIFSTPTGSTAYAYSCGGAEFHQENLYEIVAIAPYRRTMRPLVLPNTANARLVVKSKCRGNVVVDGQFRYDVDEGSVVEVHAAGRRVLFLK